jgi:putative ABC transport system ATP-binding protein
MVIETQALYKTFETPAGLFTALRGVDLTIGSGEMVAIVGKSGSGKSTLLNLIGGIDRPSSGSVVVGGAALVGKSEDQLAAWRGRHVGLVFQFFQLLPTLTVIENVMLPMDFCGMLPTPRRRGRALELLEQVGVADQAGKLPASLSGGQQQRVAVARALANEPALVLADEPTGNLDSTTAQEVLALLRGLADGGTTVVLVTHERDIAELADRTVRLADGRVVS